MLMGFIHFVLVFVEVVSALLLIGVIFLQRPRGQGAGMAFGAAVGESLFGANVGNVLTRTTVVLAVIFLVNTTLLAILGSHGAPVSVAEKIAPVPPPPPVAPVAPQGVVPPAGTVGAPPALPLPSIADAGAVPGAPDASGAALPPPETPAPVAPAVEVPAPVTVDVPVPQP